MKKNRRLKGHKPQKPRKRFSGDFIVRFTPEGMEFAKRLLATRADPALREQFVKDYPDFEELLDGRPSPSTQFD
jgi:hypothetical protein